MEKELRSDMKADSRLVVPLSNRHSVIGLLRLSGKRHDSFTESDRIFFENLAQPLYISLHTQRVQAALRERVKELTCMYGIEHAAGAETALDGFLHKAADLLPPAFQYPDLAGARIVLDDRSYTTAGFADRRPRLSADITVRGEKAGTIEVMYSHAAFTFDEGPFLKEERNLIDNVARAISLIIEQKRAREEQAGLKEQIRRADRLATIGQLAAGVAHELNEPLSAILGYAQLMGKKTSAPEQMKRDAERIVKASLHAREIVRKVLIFARQVPTRRAKADVNQIVNDGLYFLEARCARAGIRVVRKLEKDPPPLIADQSQLTQVLVNLIVNAVQAMPSGGTLTVATASAKDHVSLIIKDTGEGMTPDVKKRIFFPFFTTKDTGQGTGLGLPVVHGIVTAHGGTITVESAPGRGSRFEIRLPLSAPDGLRDGADEAPKRAEAT
ncbi:MAG: hypothetical protein JXD23_02180 [Spirochaetales bacterium]|nr:hypothetical protein [Spirochaetales bacterium]